jgi:organic radical activating enzyme
MIRSLRSEYQRAKKREEKKATAEKVIRLVHGRGGRFLVEKNGLWTNQDAEKVRDKVSHSLQSKTVKGEHCDRKRSAETEREDRLYESVLAFQQKIFEELLEKQEAAETA